MIPNYLLVSKLGLSDSIIGVMLPQFADVLGIFMLRQAMRGISKSLIEVARLDRIGNVKIMTDIVLPLVRPALISTGIIFFINSWNDYFMQLIMLSSTSNLTISLGIAKLQAENATDFGLIMAGAALAAVPIIIVFLAFQKYFTKGITMGAVKG